MQKLSRYFNGLPEVIGLKEWVAYQAFKGREYFINQTEYSLQSASSALRCEKVSDPGPRQVMHQRTHAN
ncbi:MAG: hypothetical protein COA65_01445 [Rhodospirillaceae bacterium]|nr:MAG: hypothetical protein COA65_01445 [Rhodospirillaceae bacterium]